jgi:hypothetical protein
MAKRSAVYRFSWFNKEFLLKLAVLAVGWYMCFQCFDYIKDIEPLKTFIPHEILGVESDAPVSAVKKAYRKLSREKHPDKNPDNPEAVNEFIVITKAYTVSITNITLTISVDHDRRESPRQLPQVWKPRRKGKHGCRNCSPKLLAKEGVLDSGSCGLLYCHYLCHPRLLLQQNHE